MRAMLLLAALSGCASLDEHIQSLPEADAVEPTWQPAEEPVQGDGFTVRDVAFPCGDTTCAASLYLPEGVERPPVVVMANGFCGQRSAIMPNYAERFAGAGIAAFALDYRYWGDSGGLPRYDVVAEAQVEDYLSGIAHVRTMSAVDGSRLAVWGTSFSGAHAVTVAARDPEVRALISQVPGLAGAEDHHDLYPKGSLWKLVRLAFMDKKRLKKGQERIYITAYGEGEELSFLPRAADKIAQAGLAPAESEWPNLVTPGMLLDMDEYHPLQYAKQVTTPALFIIAEQDRYVGNQGAYEAAERIQKAREKAGLETTESDVRVESIDVGHFQFYSGEPFEQTVQWEIEFLLEELS